MSDVYTYDAQNEPISAIMARVVCGQRHGIGEWRMHPVQTMMIANLGIETIYAEPEPGIRAISGFKFIDRLINQDIAVPENEILYELDGEVVGIITRLAKPEGM